MTTSGRGFIDRFAPGERSASDFFSDLREFVGFIAAELRPFPGRATATARLVVAVVAATIVTETLRVPDPDFSAYLIFFIANEDGVSSVKFGVLAMLGVTLALATALWVSICFTDAPWFRVPVTLLLIGGAIWLTRALVLGVVGRLLAVILALFLSLADVTFEPEALTESTLWLWSIAGVAVGISVLTSLLFEPRPDRLLREEIQDNLGAVRDLLGTLPAGGPGVDAQAKALRRRIYGGPARMRQLLARWRQRAWPARFDSVDWDMAIYIVERLLAAAAALAAAGDLASGPASRRVLAEINQALDRLIEAAQGRDAEILSTLALPSADDLPPGAAKAAVQELIKALAETRLILTPSAKSGVPAAGAVAGELTRNPLVRDALTNPEHIAFALKTTLAIAASEIFLNAVAWPGIRTAMITCVVTALATVGAQRQKQLLRLTGVCVGGLIGLAVVIYVVPDLNSIVGLVLLVAAGTAVCGWVALGSVRSSYAGFQMALAFFIVVLPGFDTSIDLTAIRDRFVGILVGIMAMWIFVDNLWHSSSRRQLVDRLIAILRLMGRARQVVTPGLPPAEARARAGRFRDELYGELSAGRVLLDETKIELTLAFTPSTVRGHQLEAMATEVSFAGLVLLGINERKLRALDAGRLGEVAADFGATEQRLGDGFLAVADAFYAFTRAVTPEGREQSRLPAVIPGAEAAEARPVEAPPAEADWATLYRTLQGALARITRMDWLVQRLP
ncbi:MAG: FUSC family protein [Verrucomicrobiota bacterium]